MHFLWFLHSPTRPRVFGEDWDKNASIKRYKITLRYVHLAIDPAWSLEEKQYVIKPRTEVYSHIFGAFYTTTEETLNATSIERVSAVFFIEVNDTTFAADFCQVMLTSLPFCVHWTKKLDKLNFDLKVWITAIVLPSTETAISAGLGILHIPDALWYQACSLPGLGSQVECNWYSLERER